MQSVCKNLKRLSAIAAFGAFMVLLAPLGASANPWNGKVVFQAFWWDLNNENYPQNWYTYLARAQATRLGLRRDMDSLPQQGC
jgi:hypothetical protein